MASELTRSPDRRSRIYAGLATGVVGLGALSYVGLVDPHRPGAVFPPCPFKLLTGWDCPGCGGLRMTHDLLHGDLAAAIVDNIYLLIGLPLLVAWSLWRLSRGQRALTSALLTLVVVTAIGWTIVRNLPGFPLVPTMLDP